LSNPGSARSQPQRQAAPCNFLEEGYGFDPDWRAPCERPVTGLDRVLEPVNLRGVWRPSRSTACHDLDDQVTVGQLGQKVAEPWSVVTRVGSHWKLASIR
jgi:hypothetical protein